MAAAPDLSVLVEAVSTLDVSVQRRVIDLLVQLQAEQRPTYRSRPRPLGRRAHHDLVVGRNTHHASTVVRRVLVVS